MFFFLFFYQINQNNCYDDQLHCNQKAGFVLKQAESGAAIVYIRDMKDLINQRDGAFQLHIGLNQMLRPLIQGNDERNDEKIQSLNPFSFSEIRNRRFAEGTLAFSNGLGLRVCFELIHVLIGKQLSA